jgi:hypothetical protein
MNQLKNTEASTLLEFLLNGEDQHHHRLFDPLDRSDEFNGGFLLPNYLVSISTRNLTRQ